MLIYNKEIFKTVVLSLVLSFALYGSAYAAQCVCNVVENLKGPIAQASIVTIILLLIFYPIICKVNKLKDTKTILISLLVSIIAVLILNTSLFFTEIIIDSMFGDKNECCNSNTEKGKLLRLLLHSVE